MVVDRPRVNVHAAEPQRDDLNAAAQASAAPCEAAEDHPGGECLCAACVPRSGERATRSPKPSGRSGRRLRRAMSEASFDSWRTSLQRSRHADRLRAPALSGARAGRIPWRTPARAAREGARSFRLRLWRSTGADRKGGSGGTELFLRRSGGLRAGSALRRVPKRECPTDASSEWVLPLAGSKAHKIASVPGRTPPLRPPGASGCKHGGRRGWPPGASQGGHTRRSASRRQRNSRGRTAGGGGDGALRAEAEGLAHGVAGASPCTPRDKPAAGCCEGAGSDRGGRTAVSRRRQRSRRGARGVPLWRYPPRVALARWEGMAAASDSEPGT